MAFDLGLSEMYRDKSEEELADWLVEYYDLILIMEYFDESLILLKNLLSLDFSDIAYLKSNENTALLLLPIEEIDFQNNDGEFRIYGSFGELFDTQNEIINQSGYENVFDGKLGFKVAGEITKPNISNIVENTIIFESDGVSNKTFELISSSDRPLNPLNIAIAFAVLTAVYFFVRQSRKTK